MRSRAVVRILSLAALVAASGCSKTDDVALERKVFGEAPLIESFDVVFQQEATITCDVTEVLLLQLCANFGLPGVQATAPIEVSGKVSTLDLQARVTDADSTAEQDNILLVGASYVLPGTPKQELTLVMRDDGGSDKFFLDQIDQLTFGSKNCSDDEGTCVCGTAQFEVDTNDATERDGTFTRAVTIVDGGTPPLLQDCILQFRRQTPVIVEPGTTLEFRLDAVDRQGNLSTFPNRPSIVTGDFSSEQVRLVCTGDECGCCLLQSQGSPSLCSGRPGLNGPPGSGYEQGICNLF